ncbi:2-hydroxychromene-2-carboxylate isomerase [Halieaceae bacterium IMCC14734]|uniref:2-hydroxychromene-2-carboxylate isomerase n=1 Tax=Candidatus Litorirhabdus singularis TaxID=2518993 RepID=A0ABT3TGN4_9GAMM|nr:2-hydroxychromene-2-carboxylate isomerase [Candidatus Litorirhabdus singularis]MCX2980926.1 2-hydroxychromene-2-carboxylate isomerase [Candidatus Litorirhabdus singularis]
MLQPDFIIDVASPNAYLVHKALGAIEKRTGCRFNYVPCLLGGIFKATGNQAPMLAFGDIKGKLAYDQLEMQRFIQQHQLTAFTFNPHFPINTLTLMRGAAAMELQGQDELVQYLDKVLHYMWEEPRNLNDPEILASTLTDAGYDAEALIASTQQPEVKQRLISNTEKAVQRGTFGIPTFYVGDEMFFGKERLGQVELEVTRTR